jgi:hypothetical protein
MGRVPGPKGPECPLIAVDRAPNDEELVIHDCSVGHVRGGKGLRDTDKVGGLGKNIWIQCHNLLTRRYIACYRSSPYRGTIRH